MHPFPGGLRTAQYMKHLALLPALAPRIGSIIAALRKRQDFCQHLDANCDSSGLSEPIPTPVRAKKSSSSAAVILGVILSILLSSAELSRAQLFDSLLGNSRSISVGDRLLPANVSPGGPKGLVTGDFDGDGHADIATSNAEATITVLYGDGSGALPERVDLYPQTSTLRGIVSADFNGDTLPDIAAADPYDGVLHLFFKDTDGRGFTGSSMPTWHGARNLRAPDLEWW